MSNMISRFEHCRLLQEMSYALSFVMSVKNVAECLNWSFTSFFRNEVEVFLLLSIDDDILIICQMSLNLQMLRILMLNVDYLLIFLFPSRLLKTQQFSFLNSLAARTYFPRFMTLYFLIWEKKAVIQIELNSWHTLTTQLDSRMISHSQKTRWKHWKVTLSIALWLSGTLKYSTFCVW